MSRLPRFASGIAVLFALLMATGLSVPLALAAPLDSVPPVIQFQGVADDAVYDHAVTPVVTSPDPDLASLQLALDGAAWSSGTLVGPGRHTLAATAADTSGNTAQKSVFFMVDTVAPVLYFFLPDRQIVEVGSSDQVVTYLIELSDDVSGIDLSAGGVELHSPNGVLADVLTPLMLAAGDPLTGRGSFTQSFRIPQNSEAGVWVPTFHFYDLAGFPFSFDVSCDLFGFGGGKNVLVRNTTQPVDRVDVSFISVAPRPVATGAPVTLTASATDSLGHSVTAYEWSSSIDGILGTSAGPVFTTSALSVATHRVSVRARCDDGAWSDRVQYSLTLAVSAVRTDSSPPSTGSDAKSQYADSATITLSAFDLYGSGVEHTYYSLDGGAQVEGTSVTTSAAGSHTLSFWSVDGAGNVESPNTVSFTVTKPLVAATVGKPIAPATARRGVGFKAYGYVAPAHSTGTYLVTLYCYRYQSGKYVLRKTVKAKRFAFSATQSKYSTLVSLPYTGKWRIRARHSDAGHLASFSGYDYVTVR